MNSIPTLESFLQSLPPDIHAQYVRYTDQIQELHIGIKKAEQYGWQDLLLTYLRHHYSLCQKRDRLVRQ